MINVAHQEKDVFLSPPTIFKHGSLPTQLRRHKAKFFGRREFWSQMSHGIWAGLWVECGSMGWMRVYGLNAGLWVECGSMGWMRVYGLNAGLWVECGSMGWMRVYGLNALAFNGAASPNDGNRPVPTGFPHWKNVVNLLKGSRLQKWRLKFWVWGCCFIYVVYPDAMSLTFFKRHLCKASRFKNLLGNSWNLFA